jgi:hypothetical protein
VTLAREPALTAEEIARSPAWYPLETLPSGDVRLVRLEEAAYLEASFLDQRILALGYAQARCPAALLEAAAVRLTPAAYYIFHTGHVGSTLISRLLGAHAGFFSVREPLLLRAVAARADPGGGVPSLTTALTLLGRTWRREQRALVKVTSFVSELAGSVLEAPYQPRAILMFAQPLAYLRSIFAGPNSRAETRQLAASRQQRLARRLGEGGGQFEVRCEGELIAMSWLCEMSALRAAAGRFGSRILWVDFDRFLSEPVSGLRAMCEALGAQAAAQEIESLIAGPLMRQYSKAPQHAYDAGLRRELLHSAEQQHGAQIRRGMLWLQQLSARHPVVADILR